MKDDRVDDEMETRVPETAISRDKELRKERKPMYEQKSLTYLKKDPNFRYRMVNDTPGKIARFQEAGWSIVKGTVNDTYSGKGRKEVDHRGSAVRGLVNPGRTDGEDGIMMRIPIEDWNADQLVKEQRRAKIEEELVDADGKLREARILGPRSNIRGIK